MTFELTRGHNTKCPPFLILGLIIVSFFLLCNWWSLSTHNFELLKQIDILAEQVRASGEELGKCSQQQILLDEKLKDSKTKFVQQQIQLEQFKDMGEDIKEGYGKIQAELNDTKKMCEITNKKLEKCNSDKDFLQKLSESQAQNLDAFEMEKKNLKLEIEKNNLKIKALEEKINSVSKKDFLKSDISPILNRMQNKIKQSLQTVNGKSKTSKIDQIEKNRMSEPLQEVEEIKNDGDPNFVPSENYDQREREMKGP